MSFKDLTAGSLASCFAVTFTNPLDLLKTKHQLQSELSLSARPIFSSLGSSFQKIYSTDGKFRGIQAGLSAAYAYQLLMNGTRFFCYQSLKKEADTSIGANLVFGALSGALGAAVAAPFNLVKVRMQSFSPSHQLKTGDQHSYKNVMDGLYRIFKKNGFSGFYEGSRMFIFRTGIGSCAQLAFYDASKSVFESRNIVHSHLAASFVAGFMNSAVICPFDVLATRLCNQAHKGIHYNGILDCFSKSVRNEGLFFMYKGFLPLFLRLGPHSILTFVAYERIKQFLS